MPSFSTSSDRIPNWRELYQAALFETDRQKMAARISLAESALIARGRELFSATDKEIAEQRAINNALNALHALQTCLGIKRPVVA